MYDYYRVRFRKLIGPRSPIRDVSTERPAIEPPLGLRAIRGSIHLLTSVGIVLAVALGRGSSSQIPGWLYVPVALLPISATLSLGFMESQRWTRPLLVALPALASLGSALGAFAWGFFQFWVFSALLLALSLVVAGYLYGAAQSRAYYEYLGALRLVALSSSDFRAPELFSLYTGAAGFIAGAYARFRLATWYLGYSSGLSPNDLLGIVGAMVLLGSGIALLGGLAGEAIASRFRRAA